MKTYRTLSEEQKCVANLVIVKQQIKDLQASERMWEQEKHLENLAIVKQRIRDLQCSEKMWEEKLEGIRATPKEKMQEESPRSVIVY